MGRRTVSFRYKTGSGFLYRLPPAVKILLILPLSVSGLLFPPEVSLAFIAAAALAAFLHKFSVKEQLADIKPALYYFVFLYVLQFLTVRRSFIPPKTLADDILRLLLVMQISGLLFRTTSPAALKDGMELIERKIRAALRRLPFLRTGIIKEKPRFAVIFALFLSFIPVIFEAWNSIELAWTSRGGRNNIKKIKTLLPVLFYLSFNEAREKTRALAARGIL